MEAGEPRPAIHRLLAQLDEVSEWIRAIGLEAGGTRFATYASVLHQGAERELSTLPAGAGALAIEALVPCLEIIQVHQHLAPIVDPDRLRPRLERLLAGPPAEADESADEGTTDARNTGFELVIGAQLAEAGAAVVLPEDGDLTVEFGGATAAIECKRVQAFRGVRKRVKRGGEQLAARGGLPPDALRFVALDVSLVGRPASHLVAVPTHEDVYRELTRKMDHIRPRITLTSERVAGPETHGVILMLAAPAHAKVPSFWSRAEHRTVVLLDGRLNQETRAAMRRFRPALARARGVRRPW